MARILIDLDDTIADWGEAYDRHLDIVDTTNVVTRYNYLEDYNLFGGEHSDLVRKAMDIPGFYSSIKPFPHAINAVNKLAGQGHDITFVSTPWPSNPTCASDKYNWIAGHFGQDWTKKLILTHDKTIIPGDILIDDKPHITGAQTPEWDQILFARPHNRHNREEFKARDAIIWGWEIVSGTLATGNWDSIIAKAIAMRQPLKGNVGLGNSIIPSDSDEVRTTSSTGGQKGVKLARYDLIPVEALRQVAEHYGRGAEKYDDNQWRKAYEWSKSYAALQRHANSFWAGEDFDPETGSNHMAAVAWHALTLLTFFDEAKQFDDRFKP